MRAAKPTRNYFTIMLSAIMLAVMLVVFASGTLQLGGSGGSEGAAAVQSALVQASVLCYATEGFYPPGLSYIEEHYGVTVDTRHYAVRYRAVAPNVPPDIQVVQR